MARNLLHLLCDLGMEDGMGKTIMGSAAATAGLAVAGGLFAVIGGLDNVDDATGFRDGFVAGYGQTCTIAGQPAETRWGSSAYSHAYVDGLAKGVEACRDERRRTPAPAGVERDWLASAGSR